MIDDLPTHGCKADENRVWWRRLLMIATAIFVTAVSLYGAASYQARHGLSDGPSPRVPMDLSSFSTALVSYEQLGGTLPSTAQGLRALVERPTTEPLPRDWVQIMSSLQKDPWNNAYRYERPGKHNQATYDLYSAGPDKTPGTKDDVGNWDK